MQRSFFLFLLLPVSLFADVAAGHKLYDGLCSVCHGGDLMGGELGPGIIGRITRMDDQRLLATIHDGLPNRGMPGFPNVKGESLTNLTEFLRSVRFQRRAAPPVRKKIETTDGRTVEGLVLNQSSEDLQLRTDDKRIHLFRAAGAKWRPVTSEVQWPSYNGDMKGNRYTSMAQITPANVSKLGQSLHEHGADHAGQRVEASAKVDLHNAGCAAHGDHSGSGGRDHVRDQCE
jgi:hypothetical protein